jgi:hypothetical protein
MSIQVKPYYLREEHVKFADSSINVNVSGFIKVFEEMIDAPLFRSEKISNIKESFSKAQQSMQEALAKVSHDKATIESPLKNLVNKMKELVDYLSLGGLNPSEQISAVNSATNDLWKVVYGLAKENLPDEQGWVQIRDPSKDQVKSTTDQKDGTK